jgi:hypothetical protein
MLVFKHLFAFFKVCCSIGKIRKLQRKSSVVNTVPDALSWTKTRQAGAENAMQNMTPIGRVMVCLPA